MTGGWGKGKPKGYRAPVMDRLMARVTVNEDGCWIVGGASNGIGYAVIGIAGRQHYAHRVSYEHHIGPIPDGLVLDHLCRTTRCCNPEHLEPVTQRVNVLRGTGLPAANARAGTCSKGHDYDEANTYVMPGSGHRRCRKCAASYQQQLRDKRRANA